MAAVRTNPLHLWPQGRPANSNQTFGSIAITGIDGPWSGGDGGLRIGIEYRPPKEETKPRRLVGLSPVIVSSWPTRRAHGRVRPVADPPGQAGLLGTDVTSHYWIWSLAPDEIETIEQERGPNVAAETLSFNLEVRGVAVVGSETWGFSGDIQFSLPTADWLSLVRSLGYTTPPSLQDLAGQSMTLGPSWAWAEDKVKVARRHLALGEDRQALTTAYLLFDAIARNPFRAKWGEVLDPDEPAEKTEILSNLLKAHATALNKLGRHPADSLTDGHDRQMLPLDHWEAELLVALSQMLLASVERWRAVRKVPLQERPANPPGTDPT